ncbi:hypothetical protein CRE_03443 [Caenorhabditis remanei]|uniref:Uncharacterized protein n=1 Tax=Caenorhabditis remanei TaxID=31234 RepID=E3NE55_CAERE|nr:hypothetical protein CRE_03443 [Caenorhabditis remanei]
MSPHLAAFVGLGLFVKNLIVATDNNPNDPVLAELGNSKRDLKTLAEKIGQQFDDLKAFQVSLKFFENFTSTTSVLYRAMTDVTESNNREASERVFKRLYDRNHPFDLTRTMMQMIGNDETNPLKIGMKADPLETKRTFSKWKDLFGSIITQLWLIECFAIGMNEPIDTYELEKIEEENSVLEHWIENWKQDYLNNAHFWPDKIRQFVGQIQDENVEKSNQENVELIKAGLEKILTDDLFYVMVFNEKLVHSVVANPNEQHINSSNRGGCNVLVHRSKRGREASHEEMHQFRADIEGYAREMESWSKNSHFVSWEQVRTWAMRMRNCAFMVVMQHDYYVAVESTGRDIHEMGAGWWLMGNYNMGNMFQSYDVPFLMLAGFE